MSQAVLIAIGVDWDGRRQILAVEMANRESGSSWNDFLLGLRRRGLNGVEFVVADDHAGLRAAVREVLTEAAFQRWLTCTSCATLSTTCHARPTTTACRNCAGSEPVLGPAEGRTRGTDAIIEEARRDLSAWIAKWGARYQKLVDWVEETIEETLTFYRLPRQHHMHLKSTNMLERFNEEIKRRTHVVRTFPTLRPVCVSSEP